MTRPPRARRRHLRADLHRHHHPLGMHAVPGQIVHPHRLEGAGAHVQRQITDIDARRLYLRQRFGVEVQPRGGRRDRARMAAVDGLITTVVERVRGAANVRRQRQLAHLIQPLAQRQIEMQTEKLTLAITNAGHHPLSATGKLKARAGRQRLAAAQLNKGLPIARQALDQCLDTPAAGPPAAQPGANHARVVQQQQVAGAQQGWQVGEGAVANGRSGRQVQQATGAALRQRLLGDQRLGQCECEVLAPHGAADGSRRHTGGLSPTGRMPILGVPPRPGWRNR